MTESPIGGDGRPHRPDTLRPGAGRDGGYGAPNRCGRTGIDRPVWLRTVRVVLVGAILVTLGPGVDELFLVEGADFFTPF